MFMQRTPCSLLQMATKLMVFGVLGENGNLVLLLAAEELVHKSEVVITQRLKTEEKAVPMTDLPMRNPKVATAELARV